METLIELADRHKTAKRLHNYMPRLQQHLDPIRETTTSVLELGVATGVSLRMWRDYFPNAHIIGIDIDGECAKHAEPDDRIEVIIGSQDDEQLLKTLGQFDLIIDDASHKPHQQVFSFNFLFRHHLRYGGLYVIEDMDGPTNAWRHMQNMATSLNYWPPGRSKSDWVRLDALSDKLPWHVRMVTAVHMYRFMAIVEKGHNPEDGEAAYRLANPDAVREHIKNRRKDR
jgi:demethylmacrocin O-methyltransferase